MCRCRRYLFYLSVCLLFLAFAATAVVVDGQFTYEREGLKGVLFLGNLRPFLLLLLAAAATAAVLIVGVVGVFFCL